LLEPRQLLRGLVWMATFAVLTWAWERVDIGHYLNVAWVNDQVRDHGVPGLGLFLLVGATLVAVGLPRTAVSYLAGYALGLVEGTALALIASILGSAATFFYARLMGRELVRRRLGARARRVDEFLGRNSFSTIVAIRFLPVGSNLLTNLVAGISAIPAPAFLLGSAVGFVPQTIVFALLGSGVRVDRPLIIGLSVALFVVSALLGAMIYRRRRAAASD
jgi:uncharacterized membrane protein YdjX (TVP38/TMEM64 family)